MATFGERVVGAMRLDANTFEEVERDPTAMGQAVGVIVLAAVSAGIGNLYWGGLTGIVRGVITSLVGYVIWAVIVWLIGTKVMPDPGTKADFPETFRVIGFAAAPGLASVITIIPILGYLLMLVIWLWMIVAMVIAVRAVLDYSNTGKAVIVVLIGFVVNLCASALLAMMFFGSRMIGGGRYY